MIIKSSSGFEIKSPTDISGCIAYYNFETGSGAVIDSINGYNGTLTNNPTYVSGRFGDYAMNFTGTSTPQGIYLPSSFIPHTASISFWQKANGNGTPDAGGTITSLNSNLDTRTRLFYSNSKYIRFIKGNPLSQSDVYNVNLGQWYHVVLTWDATTLKAKMYVNARLINEFSYTDNTTSQTTAYFGTFGFSQPNPGSFNGEIDEIAIYDRVLETEEVNKLYNQGYPKFMEIKSESNNFTFKSEQSFKSLLPSDFSGCVAYFPLSTSGTYTYDSTGTYSGLVVGSIYQSEGRYTSGTEFIGSISKTSGSIVIENTPNLQISGNLTIMFWTKPFLYGYRRNPIDKSYGGEYAFTFETSGILNFYMGSQATTGSYQSLGTNTIIPLNEWTHLALVRNMDLNRLFWYVNGALDNHNAIYMPVKPTGSPIKIGYGYVGSTYTGRMSDLAFFNTALSISEVQQIYNAGRTNYSEFKHNENDYILKSPIDIIDIKLKEVT